MPANRAIASFRIRLIKHYRVGERRRVSRCSDVAVCPQINISIFVIRHTVWVRMCVHACINYGCCGAVIWVQEMRRQMGKCIIIDSPPASASTSSSSSREVIWSIILQTLSGACIKDHTNRNTHQRERERAREARAMSDTLLDHRTMQKNSNIVKIEKIFQYMYIAWLYQVYAWVFAVFFCCKQ